MQMKSSNQVGSGQCYSINQELGLQHFGIYADHSIAQLLIGYMHRFRDFTSFTVPPAWLPIGYDLQESFNFDVRNLTAETNFQNNLAKAASPPTPACV